MPERLKVRERILPPGTVLQDGIEVWDSFDRGGWVLVHQHRTNDDRTDASFISVNEKGESYPIRYNPQLKTWTIREIDRDSLPEIMQINLDAPAETKTDSVKLESIGKELERVDDLIGLVNAVDSGSGRYPLELELRRQCLERIARILDS